MIACQTCRLRFSSRAIFPIYCSCGAVIKDEGDALLGSGDALSWVNCPHRGKVVGEINAAKAGCGCSSALVQIYHCGHFSEPVLKGSSDRCRDAVASVAPGYTGRQCRKCDMPSRWSIHAPATVQRLAAVTCFFNPHGGRRRVRIFHNFAAGLQCMGIPLFAIEAAFGASPRQIDSTWQVAIDPEAIFWHKENLLNIAVERLPEQYDAVLVIDADAVYRENDLRERMLDALRVAPVVQAFRDIQYLGPNGKPHAKAGKSLAYNNSLVSAPVSDPAKGYPGLAWLVRRQAWADAGGCYDRCITGGGDVAWAMGCWDSAAPVYAKRRWPESLVRDVQHWGRRLIAATRGHVPYLPASIDHLFHGLLKDRQYNQRNQALCDLHYDPQRDIETAPNGTLRWSREAPEELRRCVRDYIHGRKEDE